MNAEEKESYINTLRYFWEEKGDIERYTNFDRELIRKEFPDILQAWDDFKNAEQRLNIVFMNRCPHCGNIIINT